MRDKFRKSANTLSSKSSDRSDRGRPREREHRQPLGAHKERGRDGEFVKPKHKSRSPVRSSKLSGSPGERDGHRKQPAGELDRVVQRAKEERSSYWNKRVIEAEEKDPNRWGHSGFKELYRRDMKSPQEHTRARSPSPTNINKRYRESPSERHHQHQRHHERHVPPRRSRSPRNKSGNSRNEQRRSITPPKQQRSSNANFVPLGPRPTGTSGVRRISPLLSRVITDRKIDRDRRTRDYGHVSSRVDSGGGSGSKSSRNSNKIGGDSGGRRAALKSSEKPFGSKTGSGGRNMEESKSVSTNDRRIDRDRSDRKEHTRGTLHHDSSSISNSRSRLRSTPSPLPRNLRGSKGISDQKSKDQLRNRNPTKSSSKVAPLGSRSRSKSLSSSSSSEDEDVLQLHADDRNERRKGRGTSSLSRSSSSSTDSKTNSSSSSQISSKRKVASDSSSSSSSDSDSDDDSDVSGKISMDKTRKSSTAVESGKTKETAEPGAYKSKSSSELKSSENRSATKRPSSATTSIASKAARTSSSKSSTSKSSRDTRDKEKTTASTSTARAGESESDSGSSSDSDSEPRMTLSERFAKLTQMSTDKREFAKPLLSVNEIDTKLKVVKDLRNADMKIFVEGSHGLQQQQQQAQRSSSAANLKPRPKSPEYAYAEGEKRYTSDERRRHFERMERDEPRERPPDWSDSRVRFEYYRDRGYFSDRPLSFEEYVKWEEWWYQYRDWLQHEGYYPSTRVPTSAVPRGNGNFPSGEGSRAQSRNSDWNQPTGVSPRLRLRPGLGEMPSPGGGRLVPLSSRPHFIGRPEDRGNGMGRLGIDSRSRIVTGRGGEGRAIGRAPGGSLIVNIRQGSSNYGPRGRHVGLLRGRNR